MRQKRGHDSRKHGPPTDFDAILADFETILTDVDAIFANVDAIFANVDAIFADFEAIYEENCHQEAKSGSPGAQNLPK